MKKKKIREDMEQLATLMAFSTSAVNPGKKVKERLMARVDATTAGVSSFVVAGADRKWKRLLPGVSECELAKGDGRLTRLIKIRKGFILPPHKHREREQAFILEGSCYSGKVLLKQGDFFFAEANTRHAMVRAIEDCVILLVAHR